MDSLSARADISLANTVKTEPALVGLLGCGIPAGLARELAEGNDPLGVAFARLRSAATRRKAGATYTPRAVVDAMVAHLRNSHPDPRRVVDCGAGSGRFSLALASRFPSAQIVAVERDPLAAAILRANVAASGHRDRIAVVEGDFRTVDLPGTDGQTLFVGNPPYVRHHDIEPEGKEWLATVAQELGVSVNRLSGLHVHFFLRVMQLAKVGDAGLFITSAEWLEAAYGKALREMLAGPLGGTEVFAVDPKTSLFEDAQVTSAITEFHVGTVNPEIRISPISGIEGMHDPARPSVSLPRSGAGSARRWSADAHGDVLPDGMCRLGDMFSVHRGQVTGGNDVWVETDATPRLPERFLKPCVTKATDLINADGRIDDGHGLKRVICLPADLSGIEERELESIQTFLAWAESKGAKETFTAKARKSWWAISFKAPAPILCTYMGRRPPVFVRNPAGVAHVNIAHGLYPRATMTDDVIDRVAGWLAENPVETGGKTYGGGLRKFEPREIERIAVPKELFGSMA